MATILVQMPGLSQHLRVSQHAASIKPVDAHAHRRPASCRYQHWAAEAHSCTEAAESHASMLIRRRCRRRRAGTSTRGCSCTPRASTTARQPQKAALPGVQRRHLSAAKPQETGSSLQRPATHRQQLSKQHRIRSRRRAPAGCLLRQTGRPCDAHPQRRRGSRRRAPTAMRL